LHATTYVTPQLDTQHEREAGLKAAADKATEALSKVRAERDTLAGEKKRLEAEFGSLKQAARGAMLELANQKQRADAEVSRCRGLRRFERELLVFKRVVRNADDCSEERPGGRREGQEPAGG
jgi:predicted  nucleic acid-binding Zn-ribbon protein